MDKWLAAIRHKPSDEYDFPHVDRFYEGLQSGWTFLIGTTFKGADTRGVFRTGDKPPSLPERFLNR
jgi:hypothetical protein